MKYTLPFSNTYNEQLFFNGMPRIYVFNIYANIIEVMTGIGIIANGNWTLKDFILAFRFYIKGSNITTFSFKNNKYCINMKGLTENINNNVEIIDISNVIEDNDEILKKIAMIDIKPIDIIKSCMEYKNFIEEILHSKGVDILHVIERCINLKKYFLAEYIIHNNLTNDEKNNLGKTLSQGLSKGLDSIPMSQEKYNEIKKKYLIEYHSWSTIKLLFLGHSTKESLLSKLPLIMIKYIMYLLFNSLMID